ncbi:hypothetical protein AM228_23080 [Planktothricoides sp. SR001]|nr:hypothetical protein AM228_23080 [Planktothricoides sp. SR001]
MLLVGCCLLFVVCCLPRRPAAPPPRRPSAPPPLRPSASDNFWLTPSIKAGYFVNLCKVNPKTLNSEQL